MYQSLTVQAQPQYRWVYRDDYNFLYKDDKVVAGYDFDKKEFRWFDRDKMAWGPVTQPPWEQAE